MGEQSFRRALDEFQHRFEADAITWGPRLMALSAASALCPA